MQPNDPVEMRSRLARMMCFLTLFDSTRPLSKCRQETRGSVRVPGIETEAVRVRQQSAGDYAPLQACEAEQRIVRCTARPWIGRDRRERARGVLAAPPDAKL